MTTINLFGEEVLLLGEKKKKTNEDNYQIFKKENFYRESSALKRRCESCKHVLRKGMWQGFNIIHGQGYYKCKLIGRASCDVSSGYVCNKWDEHERR